MSSVNDGNITQEPGDGASFSFSGTSSQFLDGTGTPKDLSAADIPDHSADKLTSGTVAAARLPGVLTNVDTQGELLAAAGAQAAATGTPNGSKYLRDDNSWQAVSVPSSACAGYSTSSQAISASNFTEITWPAETVDTDSIHSTSSNQSRFVAPTAGKYLFATTLFLANLAASGAYRSYHRKNGTMQRQIHSYGVASQVLTITQVGVYDLAAGDYLTVGTYSAAGTYDVVGETFAADHSSTAVFVRAGT